jgi:VanZ family protein
VKPKFISFLPALIWLIITFILLVMPGSDIPQAQIFDLIYFDKWVHVGMFGLLTILWGYPFFKTNIASTNLFTKITVCVILYGVLMEFVQKFFAFERSFDFLDILADSIGCLLALWWLIHRFKKIKIRNA